MITNAGRAWRRIALATLGLIILALLGLSLSEGAIYFGGARASRSAQPVRFWCEMCAIGAVAVGLVYLATFGARLVGLAPSQRS